MQVHIVLAEVTQTEIGTVVIILGILGGIVIKLFKLNDRFAKQDAHDKLEKRVEIVEKNPTRDDLEHVMERLRIIEAAQKSVNDDERERKHLRLIVETIEIAKRKTE